MPNINNYKILIVDDDPDAILACSTILKLNGFGDVESETDSRKVMEKMSVKPIDIVILDLFMPHLTGIDLLPLLQENYPQVTVIMLTASYDIKQAVTCMKLGAFDYLSKPVENELLVNALRKAFERKELNEQVTELRDRLVDNRLDHPEVFERIVTRNCKMRSLCEYIEIISTSSQVVLISGESGTGKELVAQAIYRLSGCKGEFVPVNLAGVDDQFFSDILFGHTRGAFTGADQMRDGLIVKAANGVIFLDEIGDLSESSQIKLLRLIQERKFYPVGSDKPSKCTARIVCASNKDIKGLVAAGKFRNDLYYRLIVHQVALPPLKERKEDIPLLLEHFIGVAAQEVGIKAPAYPKEILELLAIYHFPGNIRELQAMVFDAVALSKAGILSLEPFRHFIVKEKMNTRALLPAERVADHQAVRDKLELIWGHFPTIREANDLLIDTALDAAKGNQGIAATMLGLNRSALSMRLKARKNAID
jgi:two-component system, NtrC family, response regulator HydG